MATLAILEAQKAICDASENGLHGKYKQRDEIKKQIRPDWEQARKRSRINDTLFEGGTVELLFIYLRSSQGHLYIEN